jgi:Kef-type K+ transport system membrane component KefB
MPTLLPLLAALALIIAAAKLAGTAANRLGQPAVLGELLAGLLLGPSALGLFSRPYFAGVSGPLQIIGDLGVIFLMFAAGLEVEFDAFLKAGRPALLAGACGVLAALGLGVLVAGPFGYSLRSGLFIGIVMSATSVSIAAQTLMELKQLRTRAGLTLLGAAVADDVLALVVLSAFVALAGGSAAGGPAGLGWIGLRLILFFAAALAVGRALPALVAWGDRLPVSQGAMAWVIVTVLLFAWASEVVGGVAGITGAFLAGLALGRSHLRKQISAGVHVLTYAFFVPVFLVNIGLLANLRALTPAEAGLAVVICLAAVAAKLGGSGLGARLGGLDWPDSLRVGAGMISRGEVNLIVAGAGVSLGLITNGLFSIAVVMVLFTALVTPLLVRRVFPAPQPAYAADHRPDR